MDVIRAADWVINLGVEDGKHGGKIVAGGTLMKVTQVRESATGRWILDDAAEKP